ncbi:hypothetical protein HID58_056670 [Brassica napus]|uniref:Uncharacterized protein n=1 Tax=Brassica napus TaxID=3708 RepID=A0ABQ8ANY1_BRANA|nr:hypothetical protein HID58_056670 [Brassica napus]
MVWSRLSSPPPFKFQKEAVSRYLLFRCSAANPFVRYLRDGTGAEPYNLRFHQPVPHLLFISWLICVGWDSQGHALSSSGVDNVWSRFQWVLMAGPRLDLPCFACRPCWSRLRDGLRVLGPFSGPGIMSVPRSTEAKCLLLVSSIAKLWSHSLIVIKLFIFLEEQLALISFLDARS